MPKKLKETLMYVYTRLGDISFCVQVTPKHKHLYLSEMNGYYTKAVLAV